MTNSESRDYERIERAIEWLAANWREQPSLASLAARAGISPEHFDRMFTRWAGVSPIRFARFLAKEHALERLAAGDSVLDAALDAGMSGPGRLHDALVTFEAISPGEARAAGAGVDILHGIVATPFGNCFLATTPRGVCRLEFLNGGSPDEPETRLRRDWPAASFAESRAAAGKCAAHIFDGSGRHPALHIRGTNFQIQVWQALLRIPSGTLTTYQQIARAIGSPGACRAVGTAVGANPVSVLIPCHRVIRKTGVFGNYRWGPARKLALCGWEAARRAS